MDPLDLLPNFYGCGAGFSISYSLDCKKGGLVTTCHNKLHYRVAGLDIKSFTPSHVCNYPLIYPGRVVWE